MKQQDRTFEIHGDEARCVCDVSPQSLSLSKEDITLDLAQGRVWIVGQRGILQTDPFEQISLKFWTEDI